MKNVRAVIVLILQRLEFNLDLTLANGAETKDEAACFSSETLVTHSERGLISISEIEVEDCIKSDTEGSFSQESMLSRKTTTRKLNFTNYILQRVEFL